MPDQVKLSVEGMTCDHCEVSVGAALERAGLEQVTVDWRTGGVTARAGSTYTPERALEEISAIGYKVRPEIEVQGSDTLVADAGVTTATKDDRDSTKAGGEDVDFDLVVIGTGGAGMAAAIKGAELGRSVAIIEAGTIGGTCVNIGCVPSKALLRAAEAYHTAGNHPFSGVSTSAGSLDWAAMIRQKDELVVDLRESKYVDVLASYGDNVTLLKGRATLDAEGGVSVDGGAPIMAGKVVVATGARPHILPLEGIDDVDVLDSTAALALEAQPRSLIVIGGRAVALELGQIFARFGTEVTMLQRSERLIPEHEPELSEGLEAYLTEEGLKIHTGATPLAIRREGDEKVITANVNGEQREFRAEEVLMAVGRTPNTDGLGLEEAGVRLDGRGFIEVDDSMQTSNPNVFAAGDVTTRPQLVYVAAAAGGTAASNALEGEAKLLDLTVLPDVIFTSPQVASVGLTEAAALEQGYAVKVSNLPLEYVPRALAAQDTRGVIKLVAETGSDRLLGAHVLAVEGGEIVQTAALAIRFGVDHGFTVADLRSMLFPYLTQVEGLKLAAQTFDKDVSQLSCCAG